MAHALPCGSSLTSHKTSLSVLIHSAHGVWAPFRAFSCTRSRNVFQRPLPSCRWPTNCLRIAVMVSLGRVRVRFRPEHHVVSTSHAGRLGFRVWHLVSSPSTSPRSTHLLVARRRRLDVLHAARVHVDPKVFAFARAERLVALLGFRASSGFHEIHTSKTPLGASSSHGLQPGFRRAPTEVGSFRGPGGPPEFQSVRTRSHSLAAHKEQSAVPRPS